MLRNRIVGNSATITDRAGLSLEIGTAQSVGIVVDNYSGYWLQVGSDAMYVPPYTLGWAGNMFGSVASSVVLRKGVPSTTVANPTSGNDGAIVAAIYDTAVAPNPGVPMITSRPLTRVGQLFSSRTQAQPSATLNFSSGGITAFSITAISQTAGGIARLYGFVEQPSTGAFDDLFEIVVCALAPTAYAVSFNPTLFPPDFTVETGWDFGFDVMDVVGVNTVSFDFTVYGIAT